MELFYRELGGKGQPLIILHGLFGSSDNWLPQAKLLSQSYHVYLIDQRNHGQSPNSEDFNYALLADDLHEFLLTRSIEDPVLLGHSMGGKTCMQFSMLHPELIKALIVVDISPKQYERQHDRILEGLKALPVESLPNRQEADNQLASYVSDLAVRQFLLKNLQRREEGGFSWKINLQALEDRMEDIIASIELIKPFEKPTLFVRGKRSDYVLDEDLPAIREMYPNMKLETMPTGHWVQAEKPVEFVEIVDSFLAEIP